MKALKGKYIPAIFSLDFSDSTIPHFDGYYLETEKDFPKPYFLNIVADKIMSYTNSLPKESQSDTLKWTGDTILFKHTIDNETENINPVIIRVNDMPLVVWPIGHNNWSWEHRRKIKTILPPSISNIDEAKAYLTALYLNGESYHLEDDVADCFDNILETDAAHMNKLSDQIYDVAKGTDFDPCLFLCELDPNYKME